MFNDSTILLTGGTGSFGTTFVRMTLEKYNPKKLIIYSRDEMKQWELAKQFAGDKRIRFFIGDVRDRDRMSIACRNVDYLIHAAALKIIPTAEYNPFECIKTNVMGAVNVIDCAQQQKIKRVVALSTDKACNPINLYGATKLCSDKLFASASSYVSRHDTRFAVVRYGNVMGSRGSVIPFFRSQRSKGSLPITDARMTRFMLTLEQAVELVWFAMEDCIGGEIYVPKIPSMRITDIATAVAPDAEQRPVGIRPGEKLHEQMISVEDARHTYDYGRYFKIMPNIDYRDGKFTTEHLGRLCPEGFQYSSDSNTEWMSAEELRAWMRKEYKDEAQSAARPATTILETDGVMNTSPAIPMPGSAGGSRAELYLAKAATELQLGLLEDAKRSLHAVLDEEPAHGEGARLLLQLEERLGHEVRW